MTWEQLLAAANSSLNRAAIKLRSNNPFGGNTYLMTGISAIFGFSALYLGSGIVFSVLGLAFKASCYGLAISYFSKNPNLLTDFTALSNSIVELIQNPSEQVALFFEDAKNFIAEQANHLAALLKGERRLLDQPITDLQTTINFIATAALITTLSYSTFYSALGIALRGGLVAGLSVSSLYMLNLRMSPAIWNEDINAFIRANSLGQKIQLIQTNATNLLVRKFSAFASFLHHQHFAAPLPAAPAEQQHPADNIAPEVLAEVPVELRQLSRVATMLFSTAQQAAAGLQRGFAPANR